MTRKKYGFLLVSIIITMTLFGSARPEKFAKNIASAESSNQFDPTISLSSLQPKVTSSVSSNSVSSSAISSKEHETPPTVATKASTPTPDIQVTGITLNKSMVFLKKNSSKTISATINPSNTTNKAISWQSGDTSVASINLNGSITANAIGVTTVNAISQNSVKSDLCKVCVYSNNIGEEVPFFISGVQKGTYKINSATVTQTQPQTLDPNKSASEQTIRAIHFKCTITNSGVSNQINSVQLGVSPLPPSKTYNTYCQYINMSKCSISKGNSQVLTCDFSLNHKKNTEFFIHLQNIHYNYLGNKNGESDIDVTSIYYIPVNN